MTSRAQRKSAGSYFSGDAAHYNDSRPAYPQALIQRIAEAIPGGDVLNAGCGTGIEARQFQAAGCSVLGVDPDTQLAEFARGTGVPVEVSRFEEWEPAGRTFDAVVAGTAWHWVDPIAGAAKAATVLRQRGLLAVFHHASLTPPEVADAAGMSLPPWTLRSADAYRQAAYASAFSPDGRRRSPLELYQPMFDTIADGIGRTGGFGEVEQWHFGWERTFTRAEWLKLLPTQGALAQLTPERLAEVLRAVGDAIDRMGGSFAMPYATIAVAAVRKTAN
ncbi:class I SAM-dependent methyltransferase [Paractinoplanes ferrugineus]|uniref:Methyltransferase type 11 n=1 Tax=Paractinoplanes ferrugineus TaxID=113564 RepID=A0A919MH47_9ACTN|nr:class I SAM-dependent methyltransferase [Actinoplanes ferrugineus]GIE15468.1 methyltransferase type 11 [Actinoplanes ferrugineus]